MKWLVRGVAALVVLLVLALGGLWLALPSIVEAADLRGRLDAAAREAIGRGVDFEGVEIGLLPPRLKISDLEVSGLAASDPPALRAGEAALVLAWRPLLSGRAEIDALVIERAELRMVRTAEGIDLLAAAVPAAPAAAAEPEASGAAIGIHRVSLRDSRIVFDDRAVAPNVVWDLGHVSLDATGAGLGEPVDFTLSARLASGGDLEGGGRFVPAGETYANLAVAALALDHARPYVDALDRLSGAADVTLGVRSPADGATGVELAVRSDAVSLASGDTTVEGAVVIRSTLALAEATTGSFSVDLTEATLDAAGGAVHKRTGEVGSYEGDLLIEDGGVTIPRSHLQLRNLGAAIQLRTAPALRVELAAPAFVLDGWETVIPALADSAPTGELEIERLVYSGEPESLVGLAALRRVVVQQGEGSPPLVVDGFVDATGNAIAVRDMFASVGAARLAVSGGVEDLFGTQDVTVRLDTPEVIESNDVFSLVDSLRDAVFGALAIEVDLGLPLAGPRAERPALERLAGTVSFQIGGDEAGGRIKGVSMLQRVFDRFGALGYAAMFALPSKRGKSMDDYYSEKFELLGGSFVVEDGVARTEDLRLVHATYKGNLRGSMRLDDLALDLRGEISIGPELDMALSGKSSGAWRTIPIAKIGGTLTDPSVKLDQQQAARFVAGYALQATKTGKKIGKKLDEALGTGASDLLQDILGGAAKE